MSKLRAFKYYSKGDYGKKLRQGDFLFIIVGESREEADKLFQLSTGVKLEKAYVKEEPAFTKVDFEKLGCKSRNN